MATVPLSGTNIRLLAGVPFQSDYKHTRWFDTITEQTNWFSQRNVVYTTSSASPTYFKRNDRGAYIRLERNIDSLFNVNYLMFQNATFLNKWFYAFVTHLEYVNVVVTNVYFQIDVLQTWKFDLSFKESYVLREHCQLWNEDGSPVINTQDEGLNYGSNYETVNVMNWKPYKDILFLVIVMKQTAHLDGTQEALSSINAVPQPLCYYIHPFHKDGSQVGIGIDAPEDLGFSTVLEVLDALGKNTNTVNNVVSIYVTDYIGVDVTYDEGFNMMTFPSANFMQAIITDGKSTTQFSTLYVKDMKSYIGKSAIFADKYSDYRTVKESKLLMYPYTVLMLDDLKGNRQILKNEYIAGDDIIVTVHGSIGTSNKTTYGIENYLKGDLLEAADWFYHSLENSVINSNPNDLPIITDMLAAYLQGNRNSIQNQTNSTIFNGVIDAFAGVSSAVTGGATGAIQGSMFGPTGAIAGGVEGALGGTMQTVKGAGNTYFALQSINAKQKDINNVPPSLSKLGGNTYFDYGNGINGLYLIKKQITAEYQQKLEDFFNLFGYKVNEIKMPNFHTRQYWNYIQTSDIYIAANINNDDLNEIKSIFNGGITLWHTDDIGNYTLENEVI